MKKLFAVVLSLMLLAISDQVMAEAPNQINYTAFGLWLTRTEEEYEIVAPENGTLDLRFDNITHADCYITTNSKDGVVTIIPKVSTRGFQCQIEAEYAGQIFTLHFSRSQCEFSVCFDGNEKHYHNMSDTPTNEVKPSCKFDGYQEYACTICKKIVERVEIPAHQPMTWTVTCYNACMTPGERVRKCAVCNEVVEREVLPALPHAWTDWVTDLEATATMDGRLSRFCTTCGKEDTIVIPRTN